MMLPLLAILLVLVVMLLLLVLCPPAAKRLSHLGLLALPEGTALLPLAGHKGQPLLPLPLLLEAPAALRLSLVTLQL